MRVETVRDACNPARLGMFKESPESALKIGVACLAFPHRHDFPAQRPEPSAIPPISLNVSHQLWQPIISVCRRLTTAAFASVLMPKATVDQDRLA